MGAAGGWLVSCTCGHAAKDRREQSPSGLHCGPALPTEAFCALGAGSGPRRAAGRSAEGEPGPLPTSLPARPALDLLSVPTKQSQQDAWLRAGGRPGRDRRQSSTRGQGGLLRASGQSRRARCSYITH